MKRRNFNYASCYPMLIALLIIGFLLPLSLKAQEKTEKKVVKVKIDSDEKKTERKEVMVEVKDGKTTATVKVYKDGELISEDIYVGAAAEKFFEEEKVKMKESGKKSEECEKIVTIELENLEEEIEKYMEDDEIKIKTIDADSCKVIWKSKDDVDVEMIREKLSKHLDQEKVDEIMKEFEDLEIEIEDMGATEKSHKVIIIKDGNVIKTDKAEEVIIKEMDVDVPEGAKYEKKVVVIIQKFKVEDDIPGSTKQSPQVGDVKIYPNPGDGNFIIELDLQKGKTVEVNISDMNGKTVFSKKLQGIEKTREKIDTGISKKGVYIIQISEGKKKTSRKLIVE